MKRLLLSGSTGILGVCGAGFWGSPEVASVRSCHTLPPVPQRSKRDPPLAKVVGKENLEVKGSLERREGEGEVF